MKFTALLCTLIVATAVSASTVILETSSRFRTPADLAMAVTKGVRTVLARPRTEIGISAAATGLVWLSAGMVDGLRSKTAMLPPATVPMMAQPGARVIPMELEW
ncbi:hypothetical protein KXV70_002506 [Aspergillus fumigatus]|nr:hypothetical protein KXV70_002506 [Aspergillus fumigatus]